MLRKTGVKIGLFILLVASLGACAGMEPSFAEKQLRLKQRCEGYVEARIKSDLSAMQNYYRNSGQARLGSMVYKSSEIVALTVAEDGKHATTKLHNSIMAMGFTFDKAPQTLTWEWYNKDWYIVVKTPSASPFGNLKSNGNQNTNVQK